MDSLGDELLSTKVDFFDFKLEGGSFPDSLDYSPVDSNNNNNGGALVPSAGPYIIDEIMLAESLQHASSSSSSSSPFELLGSYQWSTHHQTGEDGLGLTLLDPSPNWNPSCPPPTEGGEVTTLTNLLLYDPYCASQDSPSYPYSSEAGANASLLPVISSDRITSTYSSWTSPDNNNNQSKPDEDEGGGGGGGAISQESLLRTALQATPTKSPLLNGDHPSTLLHIPTTVLAKESELLVEHTELRKVLSFPPLVNGARGSPDHPQEMLMGEEEEEVGLPSETAYYQLKLIENVWVEGDGSDLLLTDINGNSYMEGVVNPYVKSEVTKGAQQLLSERKVNSTTGGSTLSAKWTLTPPPHGDPSQQHKVRRRTKKGTPPMDNNKSKSTNLKIEGGSKQGGEEKEGEVGGTRKERSLHHCDTCHKGFKDKYSVNVHVRTHTGEKPFACTLCGKNFRQKAHLAKHYQTHAAKANNSQSTKGSKSRVNPVTSTNPSSSSQP